MCKIFSQLQRRKTPLTTTHLAQHHGLDPTSSGFYGGASLPLSPLARTHKPASAGTAPARPGFHKPRYTFTIHPPPLALWAAAAAAAPPVLTATPAPAMPPTQQQRRS